MLRERQLKLRTISTLLNDFNFYYGCECECVKAAIAADGHVKAHELVIRSWSDFLAREKGESHIDNRRIYDEHRHTATRNESVPSTDIFVRITVFWKCQFGKLSEIEEVHISRRVKRVVVVRFFRAEVGIEGH